jgi:hypothetical protein
MAVLGWMSVASVAIVTGCYSPELRDCVVSCASTADCAPDQVCGSDRMCAAPDLAGRCGSMVTTADAAVDSPGKSFVDAPLMVDAAPPADASNQRFVRTEINGGGGVTLAGIGMCHHTSPAHPCTFAVMPGPLSLEAVPDPGHRFDKWEGATCSGQDATCTVVVMQVLTEIKAKFRQDEEDD